MLDHNDIWSALDRLAVQFSLSPSSLARQAGLSPTTFNKSKRQSVDGKPRWPSTESIAKVLNMLGVDFEDFAALVAQKPLKRFGQGLGSCIPLIDIGQAQEQGFFDGVGFPIGEDWDEIRVPGVRDTHVYALQISGDDMSPILRHGDRVIVAPNENIENGDRVIICTRDGKVSAQQLVSMNVEEVVFLSTHSERKPKTLSLTGIRWIARIVWVSQ